MSDPNAPWYLQQARTRRVLTIADDEGLRAALTRGLNRHRFEVVGDDSRERVDLLLVDVPSGGHLRALSLIRRLRDSGLEVPTVCLAHPSDVIALGAGNGTSTGISTVLIKPIDMAELAAELRRACSQDE